MAITAKFKHALNIESLPEWNDNPNRTQEEVLAAFDKVISEI